MLFHIIVDIGSKSYYSQIEAETNAGAEHLILDKGYCGRHGYGVNGCLAFSYDDIKTETFRGCLCHSAPVSLSELYTIIADRNSKLADHDRKAAEKGWRE